MEGSRAAIAPGDVVAGKYEVLQVLGQGGMGLVVAAVHRRIDQYFAIKLLLPELVSQPGAVSRFEREARAAGALRSPHAVQVFDVDATPEGVPYIVMELLEGHDLSREIAERGEIPVNELVDWIIQSCSAIEEAHSLGIVHRDLKPSNIFLAQQEGGERIAKIVDFGISKLLDATDRTTSTEGAFGTPQYMSPEQVRGTKTIDGRSDLWSLGVIMYRVLTKEFPFGTQSASGLAVAIATEPAAPLGDRRPELPGTLTSAVMRLLEKKPEDRFQTAAELAAVLEPFGRGRKPLVPRVSRPSMSNSSRLRSRPPISDRLDALIRSSNPPRIVSSTPPADAPTAALPSSKRWQVHIPPDVTGSGAMLAAAVAPRVSRPLPKKGRAVGVLLVALATSSVGAAFFWRREHVTSSVAPSVAQAAAAPRCHSNAECTASTGADGACRLADGVCLPVASEDCKPAEVTLPTKGERVYFGALLPLSGPMADAYGRAGAHSLELAALDFAAAGGIPSPVPGAPARQVELVLCDDTTDHVRAARHLAEIGAPVAIGFGPLDEAVEVANTVFLPNRMLVLNVINTRPVVTHLMQPDGPRLLWRPTINDDELGEVTAHFVSDYVEPQLRGASGPLGAAGTLKVALVVPDRYEKTDPIVSHLQINGKALVENGTAFRQYAYHQDGDGLAAAEVQTLADQIDKFAPQVIIFGESDPFADLLEPIEKGWRGSRRPLYVGATMPAGESLRRFVGKSVERRHRFFGVDLPANTAANLKFTLHYNEYFAPKVTIGTAPGVFYDALYLAAYAATTSDREVPSGDDLATGLLRVKRDGARFEVQPASILDTLRALRDGKNVALDGAGTQLDLDPATGEDPSDCAVYCMGVDDDGAASDPVESGLRFDHVTKAFRGKAACP
jgi:serine/threonine-protein kinase